MDRLERTILELRPAVISLLGFHDLATDAALALTPEKRAEYEAQARASAVDLASRLLPIMARIEAVYSGPPADKNQVRKNLRLVIDNKQ